jgi:hypothetical protein
MAFSGMFRRLALVRTDVSEKLSTSETSVLTRVTRRNVPEDAVKTSNLTTWINFTLGTVEYAVLDTVQSLSVPWNMQY